MWDVLSGDFDEKVEAPACIRNVMKHAQAGSIIVFHDSLKAATRMRHTLPEVLAHFKAEGFRFLALPEDPLRIKA